MLFGATSSTDGPCAFAFSFAVAVAYTDARVRLRTNTSITADGDTMSSPMYPEATSVAAIPTSETAGHWMLLPGRPRLLRNDISASIYAFAAP